MPGRGSGQAPVQQGVADQERRADSIRLDRHSNPSQRNSSGVQRGLPCLLPRASQGAVVPLDELTHGLGGRVAYGLMTKARASPTAGLAVQLTRMRAWAVAGPVTVQLKTPAVFPVFWKELARSAYVVPPSRLSSMRT